MGKRIRVGVFGAGSFTNRQHLPNLARIDGVDIVAVCDIDEERARDTADRFNIPAVYTDGHEMVDREPMDAMWSVVPASARTDVEVIAASKGIHIFSEKPQATRMSVARRIDRAISEAGVLSSVCFRERYRPIVQEAKRLLVGKEVTHIRFQSIRPLPGAADPGVWHSVLDTGGAPFFDWGPHAVDTSRFISGLDVSTAQGYLKHDTDRFGHPTSASFNYLMSNGATMTIVFACTTTTAPLNEPAFTFFYEGGYLAFHLTEYIEVNNERVSEDQESNPWFELDRLFCEAVQSGDASRLLNDYHDGLYSLGPILAAWESSKRGGQPIDIENYITSAD